MIDVHCHLLFGVDDGAKNIRESVEMLKDAKAQGIHVIILTPHYRHGMFQYDRRLIEAHYHELLSYAKKAGIRLYLGCEYHVNSTIVDYFHDGRCHTMADTNYVLMEYEFETEYSYIEASTREMIFQGYIPIIAHAERYGCMVSNPAYAAELRKMGVLIQVNCDAVLGLDGGKLKRFTKKLLKEGWADLVASDSHGIKNRASHMKQCYEYITKKYGEHTAVQLMKSNPQKILNSRATYKGEERF